MKIYVNEQYEICAVNKTDRTDLTEMEVDPGLLGNWCETALMGYKYEPSWACDENGEFILDENGERIQAGYAFYPFVDYNTLMLIQHNYEQSQAEIVTLQLALTEEYEKNLALQDEVTTNQLAMVDLYEKMEVR